MSFSRYSIEKKQVSTDRGVTWTDVDPSETRQGNLVGVARTLLECEDLACELTSATYTVIDGILPDEICNDYLAVLPFGIAKRITFTAGADCCTTWHTATASTTTHNTHRVKGLAIGAPQCVGNTCPGFTYTSCDVYGGEISGGCFTYEDSYCSGRTAEHPICTCYTIDEFMPWVQGKETWKLIQRQNYKKEHCSDAWEADGSPYIVGIGERWLFVDEDFYRERWVHQVASKYDENGNVTEWESDITYTYNYLNEVEVEDGIEIIGALRADGMACYQSKAILERELLISMIQTGDTRSGYIMKQLGSGDSYHYTYFGDDNCNIGTQGRWGHNYYSTCDAFNNDMYINISISSNRAIESNSIFCNYVYGNNDSLAVGSKCSGIESTKMVKEGTDNTLAFPYRVRYNMGYSDDYYNSSEIGWYFRDGRKIVMEHIYGTCIDTSGNTQVLANGEFDGNGVEVPMEAVSVSLNDYVTEIPAGRVSNHTSLTAITMPAVTSIGQSAFENCKNLSGVTFQSPNTTLGDYAFKGSGLRSLSLQNVSAFGTEPSGINTGYVFAMCTNLQTLDIGTSVRYIPIGAFQDCSGLTSVIIPLNVTVIGSNAFYRCTSLSSVTISEGVTLIGHSCFYGCTSLRSVTIPSSVGGYGAAFWNCSSLEYVTINTTANIEEYTFYGCNIKEVTLTVTTPPVCYNGRYTWDRFFTFADEAVILVPASAVNAYKNDTHQGSWNNVASMIHPIPSEIRWVNIGYTCVDGLKYDYERKQGRNTEYSNDWFDMPEYRTVGEPYGECTEGEFD